MYRHPDSLSIPTHSLACAFLSGVALLAGSPALAQGESSCSGLSPYNPIGIYLRVPLNQGSPPQLNLRLRVAPDATARIRGVIRIPDDAATPDDLAIGPNSTLIPVTSRLAPVCADADGDGTLGVVRVEANFLNRATGEIVPVVLTTPGQDIDASGTYLVVVDVGSDTITLETMVRVDRR